MNRFKFTSDVPLRVFKVGDMVRLTKAEWDLVHLKAFEQSPTYIDIGVVQWCGGSVCMVDWGKSNLNNNHEWPIELLERVGFEQV